MQAGTAKRAPVVGVVCDTTLPHKNVDACIKAAELSVADRVEIWGNFRDRRSTARVRWNGFTNDKRRIYGSFGVLVHLSRLENQPLVILDAMSAGIPCVLAPLAVYEIFRSVNGIFFADADDPVAVSKAINMGLVCPEDVREGLVRVWHENYSPHEVRALWMNYLGDIGKLKGAL